MDPLPGRLFHGSSPASATYTPGPRSVWFAATLNSPLMLAAMGAYGDAHRDLLTRGVRPHGVLPACGVIVELDTAVLRDAERWGGIEPRRDAVACWYRFRALRLSPPPSAVRRVLVIDWQAATVLADLLLAWAPAYTRLGRAHDYTFCPPLVPWAFGDAALPPYRSILLEEMASAPPARRAQCEAAVAADRARWAALDRRGLDVIEQ